MLPCSLLPCRTCRRNSYFQLTMEFLGISQSMASPTLTSSSFSPPVRYSRKPLGVKSSSAANNGPAAPVLPVVSKTPDNKSPGSKTRWVGSVAAHEAETLLWDQWEEEPDEEKMSPCE